MVGILMLKRDRCKRRYQQQMKEQRFIVGVLLTAAIAILVFAPIAPLASQPSPSPSATPTPTTLNLPQLDGFFTDKSSQIDRGAVRLDGRRLFLIAAPSTDGSSKPATNRLAPIDLRVEVIENRLQRLAASKFDSTTLKVTYQLDQTSKLPVLYVKSRVGVTERTDELLTVTTLDAQIHATDADTLATEWAQAVKAGLTAAWQERQSVFLRRQGLVAVAIAVVIGLGSWLLTSWQQRLAIERHRLATALKTESEYLASTAGTSTTGATGLTEVRTALLQQKMADREKRGINDIRRRLLQLGQLLLWGGGVFLILGLFPHSRWLQPLLLNGVQIPIKLLATGFGTYLVIRYSAVLVDRFFLVLQDNTSPTPETSQRLALRFSTFSQVGKSVLAVVLLAIGVIVALAVINIQVGPLLAGAGIVGLAVSFASQSLIKDMINGFFILLEDQYGVGDVIIVGEVSGAVENMNLRITQLRNEEGRLITIPNSAIAIVQNLSKEWARVDLRIDVGYSADLDQALKLIDQVAQDMSCDRHWRDLILEPPLVLGVDKLDYTGATVRLWIKTQPLKQWEVAREYRRRLKLAFDEAGIPFGIPQQSLLLRNEDDEENKNLQGLRDTPATKIQS
jgi:moderate conductance mechanosensitive channel